MTHRPEASHPPRNVGRDTRHGCPSLKPEHVGCKRRSDVSTRPWVSGGRAKRDERFHYRSKLHEAIHGLARPNLYGVVFDDRRAGSSSGRTRHAQRASFDDFVEGVDCTRASSGSGTTAGVLARHPGYLLIRDPVVRVRSSGCPVREQTMGVSPGVRASGRGTRERRERTPPVR